MVISEIFYSIQGEGLLTGVPSVFIRLAGCTLGCQWCDTKYAWDPDAGVDLTIPQIIQKVNDIVPSSLSFSPSKRSGDPRVPARLSGSRGPIYKSATISAVKSRFIVITGGEPMTNPQLARLAKALKERGKHITIETAGIAFIEGLACDLMSISPKTSNSGMKTTPDYSLIRKLINHYPYQLKFVVDSAGDLPEIQQIVRALGSIDTDRVMLMPQAKTREELLAKSPMVAELCEKAGYIFCQRLQILLYNGRRGK